MEDWEGALQSLLGSPETRRRLRDILSSAAAPADPAPASPAPPTAPTGENPPDLSGLMAALLSAGGGAPPAAADGSGGSGGPDPAALLRLLPPPGKGGGESVALLRALRPYLHGERKKRADEAIRFLQMSRLLPLLREKPPGGGN